MQDEYRVVVGEAASWLDKNWNVEEFGDPWFDVVDLSVLDMSNPCRCAAGQLGYRIAERYGMQACLPGYRLDLGGVVVPLGGYDALVTAGLHPTWSVLEAVGMQELLRYASKVIGGDGTLPPELRLAFSSATPASLWRVEIERRRRER